MHVSESNSIDTSPMVKGWHSNDLLFSLCPIQILFFFYGTGEEGGSILTPTRLNLKYILIGTYDCGESSYLSIKTKIKVQETHCLGYSPYKGDKKKNALTPGHARRTATAVLYESCKS